MFDQFSKIIKHITRESGKKTAKEGELQEKTTQVIKAIEQSLGMTLQKNEHFYLQFTQDFQTMNRALPSQPEPITIPKNKQLPVNILQDAASLNEIMINYDGKGKHAKICLADLFDAIESGQLEGKYNNLGNLENPSLSTMDFPKKFTPITFPKEE